LNNLIEQRESDLLNLREKVKRYSDANRSKQAEINTLNLELTQVHGKLRELQTQKRSLSEKINRLNQEVHQKQSETDKLINQLNQYSKIRMLKGEYIGNLSDRNSKYHFDRKCNHWKMLVGEYVLGLDTSREIVSSSTSAFFINKLGECDRCAGRKS
jgi:predicted RNase H-like nuclease (RuvC/YqgF family)